MSKCLTLAGIAGINRYVFATNKLKDNVGASQLVERALKDLESCAGADPIFTGGGRAAILFESVDAAKNAIFEWSFRWLQKAPGLRLVVAHQIVDRTLQEAWIAAQDQLLRNEDGNPPAGLPDAFAVTRRCATTQNAAEHEFKNGDLLSAEAATKRKEFSDADVSLHGQHEASLEGHFRFVKDLGDLGQEQGASQVAIIHIDGDDMGMLFRTLLASPLSDEEFGRKLKGLSDAIETLVRKTFEQLVAELFAALEADENLKQIVRFVAYSESEPPAFPLRRILEAGDDVTFITHGRIGLSVAVRYLEIFEQLAVEYLGSFISKGDRRTACAGVAIQHASAPFAAGVRLATDLTKNAKRIRREKRSGSWMDTQLVFGGVSGSPGAIRNRLYGAPGDLLLRPFAVSGKYANWGDWEQKVFQPLSELPRTRVKQLREAARRDKETWNSTVLSWKAAGIPFSLPSYESRREIWDAIELIDFHYRVPWSAASQQQQEKGS